MNSAWQTFALQNNLTLKPGNWFLMRKAQITGYYHGYYLTLHTIYRKKYVGEKSKDIYTRMALSGNGLIGPHHLRKNKVVSDNRPSKEEVVSLLLPKVSSSISLLGKLYVSSQGGEVVHEQKGVISEPNYLQLLLAVLKDLIEVYPVMIALGGEVVPFLQEIMNKRELLRPVAGQLLYDIGKDTEERLRNCVDQTWCPECWRRYSAHQVNVPWIGSFNYYGCRACCQSRRFMKSDNCWVIAELSQSLTTEQWRGETEIRVNWLLRRRLFDFDEVEIVQATDEDVERFVMQVGNDTDPIQKPRYKKMRCRIAPTCKLSENTFRVLERIFGQVELKEMMS